MILAILYSGVWLCNTIYEMILGVEYYIFMIESAILLWYRVGDSNKFPHSPKTIKIQTIYKFPYPNSAIISKHINTFAGEES
ncbi:unnamed protein product [Paramecium octaurelia]|uniref:Uncharacterized protein n=1 Tax=Paramecium octaurelia TaxID=43137 RepID=A0A8S1YJ27_PAROT|nr:unnamed protein product [Paramecium octaurelia]